MMRDWEEVESFVLDFLAYLQACSTSVGVYLLPYPLEAPLASRILLVPLSVLSNSWNMGQGHTGRKQPREEDWDREDRDEESLPEVNPA